MQIHPVGLQSHRLSSSLIISYRYWEKLPRPQLQKVLPWKGSSIRGAPGAFPLHLILLPWGDGMMPLQSVDLGRMMGVLPPSWEGSGPEENPRAPLCCVAPWCRLPCRSLLWSAAAACKQDSRPVQSLCPHVKLHCPSQPLLV